MIRLLALLMLPWLAACSTMAAEAPTQAAAPAFASDRIAVTTVGQGPDVVLIHGLSSSAEVWDATVRAMPGYRYHLVQVSGMGGRPAGANAAGPVVAPVADEIARYIRQAGLRRPAVVGHSLGGAWGMMIAARHPDLVGRLMVVDMFPFMGQMFGGPAATPESVRPVAEQFRQQMRSANAAAREASAQQVIATMVRTETLRPAAIRHSLASDDVVSSQAMYDLITTDLRPELTTIKVPVTVLWARGDGAPITAEQMGEYYRAAYANLPQARIVQVPRAWHFIMWDEPEAFQRELRTFLSAR